MIVTAIMNIPSDDRLARLPEHHLNSLQKNLCVCNEVPKINVVNAILEGATTVPKVRELTGASDGNGCCRLQIEFLIKYLCEEPVSS